MKTFLIYFIISLFSQFLLAQWAVDNLQQTDTDDQEPVPRIQFLNLNTGWLVHPSKKRYCF